MQLVSIKSAVGVSPSHGFILSPLPLWTPWLFVPGLFSVWGQAARKPEGGLLFKWGADQVVPATGWPIAWWCCAVAMAVSWGWCETAYFPPEASHHGVSSKASPTLPLGRKNQYCSSTINPVRNTFSISPWGRGTEPSKAIGDKLIGTEWW